MSNPWIQHVKAYQAENGGTYAEALKLASRSYMRPAGAKPRAAAKPKTGCKLSPKGRCVGYSGPNLAPCARNANNNCAIVKAASANKRPVTAAMLEGRKRATGTRARNAFMNDMGFGQFQQQQQQQQGGYWW